MKKIPWLLGGLFFAAFNFISCELEEEDNENTEIKLTLYDVEGDNITKIRDYQDVSADLLTLQADTELHQKMWDYYKRLIPADARNYIEQFEVFYGNGDFLGYVDPITSGFDFDLSQWTLGLAIDNLPSDLDDVMLSEDFTHTNIHEYGHILTLNNTEVNDEVAEVDCPNFVVQEGCTDSDAYINQFFTAFWEDIYDDFLDFEDEDDIEGFIETYPNHFLTSYAATNPGEDIAETFAFFVIQDNKPVTSSIAAQKILFFYDFPELVSLREEIRNNAAIGKTNYTGPKKQFHCKHQHIAK